MKKILVAVVLAGVAIVVVSSWPRPVVQKIDSADVPTTPALIPADQRHLHEYAVKGRVPSYHELQSELGNLPPTLPPEAFTGNKRLAYQVAKDIPETLAQLPCYCHCDRSQNHKSLHSCFESEHGENCGICINEALMAQGLKRKGVSVVEIRKQIIATFGED